VARRTKNPRSKLYKVVIFKWNRWVDTIWTGYVKRRSARYRGKPVSLRAAEAALKEAQAAFPNSIYRITIVHKYGSSKNKKKIEPSSQPGAPSGA